MRSVVWLLILALAACAGSAERRMEQSPGKEAGIVLARDAQVLFGTAAFCTQPATIDLAKIEAATPEGRQLERVRSGTAQHRILRSAMHKRIVAACAQVARDDGFDLVVRDGDIADARGLRVGDMTAAVERFVRRNP